MTADDLKQWRAIHEAMTPGEWQKHPWDDTGKEIWTPLPEGNDNQCCIVAECQAVPDARGIAHEHNTYAALLDMAERVVVPPDVLNAAKTVLAMRAVVDAIEVPGYCESARKLAAFVRDLEKENKDA